MSIETDKLAEVGYQNKGTFGYERRKAISRKIENLLRRERKKIFLKTRAAAVEICDNRAFMQEGQRETEALACKTAILGIKQPR